MSQFSSMFAFLRKLFAKRRPKHSIVFQEDGISELFRRYLELEQMHHDLCDAYQTAERKIMGQKQDVRLLIFMLTKDEFRPTIYQNDFIPVNSMTDFDDGEWPVHE